jgi:hypothetical protein
MPPVDDVRYYEMIRSRLEHEDGLIVHRLSWLMASQAFLFTAYAIAANGLASASGAAAGPVRVLFRLMPVVGVISTAVIYMGLLAALRAMAWLLAEYRARIPDEAGLGAPPVFTPPGIRRWGMAAPRFLPGLFLLAWLLLLVVGPG